MTRLIRAAAMAIPAVADVAHVLATPLTAFDDMDWAEVLLWHAEARRFTQSER